MFWAGTLLAVSVLLWLVAGFGVGKDETEKTGGIIASILLAVFSGLVGLTVFYCSAEGNISGASFMPSQPIYLVDGTIETSRGIVAIIEDGSYNVFAVWAGKGDDETGKLPIGTKAVRVGWEKGKGHQFIPVPFQAEQASK